MPDDAAPEKAQILMKLGAQVQRVRPVSIVSTQHFVNLARRQALNFGKVELVGPAAVPDGHNILHSKSVRRDDLVITSSANGLLHEEGEQDNAAINEDDLETRPRGLFADQFENLANFEAHYLGTGPEIWRQTNGNIDAFVAGAGTGGTLAGVAAYLKKCKPDVTAVLADPQGSGLYNRVKSGVMYSSTEAEGTRRRYQVDTVVEGIGLNRITANMDRGIGCVEDAYTVTDKEAVIMSRHLVEKDGLFLGSSSAVNLLAACRFAKAKPLLSGKKTIVTILCDSGTRHYSKFWSDEYLREHGVIDNEPLPSLESIL
ncbi:Cysteine synthase 2 [Cystobasidiomycetes sp. EMM_F5]